ncbi:ethanolaminephosphotransferase, putative [Eimeria mitis]|uniref:Ethanolaminephosphotransferase, putative n=1 Tax=Eimeria mitis TaxID=44415 RepID=U6KG92_9EIME|nr:ethanolaminephosphotransferase, putative [Eimeria mitis]CDJ35277.1 ethanolaminephosphotransferase, putative [Eimeria mitis]
MQGMFGRYLPPAGVASLHKYAYVSGHRTPFDTLMNPWWEAVEKLWWELHFGVFYTATGIIGVTEAQLTWWELHFGVFYTATGIIGVTEAQLTVMFLAVLGGTFGPEMFHVDLLQYLPTSIGIPLAKLAGAAGLSMTASVVFQLMLLVCNSILCTLNIVMGVMFLAVLGGTFGPEMFHVDLLQYLPTSIGIPLAKLAGAAGLSITASVVFQLMLLVCNSILCTLNIVMGVRRARQPFVALTQVVVFLVYIFLQGTVYMHCLVWRPVLNPYLVYTAICSTYTILLLRLCLSATCRFPYKFIQWPMLPLAAAAAALKLGNLTANQEFWTLLAVCLFNCMYLADFVYTAISDVCDGLKITCFTVPKTGSPHGPSKSSKETKKAD